MWPFHRHIWKMRSASNGGDSDSYLDKAVTHILYQCASNYNHFKTKTINGHHEHLFKVHPDAESIGVDIQ